jgi:D-beta-D-heptose 7-phosphate kinase/D-beta-D-heptose 1-phosphate adenosyltransferase
MPNPLVALLEKPLSPRVLLLGDVMLDRYLWGDVDRISPEAPIPILRVNKQEHRLGGAGNVAAMLVALDAQPKVVGIVGDDTEGRAVRELIEAMGIDSSGVLTDPGRPTTVKERLLGRSQQRYPHHMMRVDREISSPVSPATARQLLDAIAACLDDVDVVLISDYAKGVCSGEMIPRVAAMARQAGVRVLADPIRDADYSRYAGCTCITPNRTEAGLAAGMKIVTPQDGLEAARRLLAFGVESAAVTLDRDGIAWADVQGNRRHFSARPRQVCDITGAGDMVLAAVAYALAAGADYATAMELANQAGGLEVERLGVVPVTRRELLEEILRGAFSTEHKIVGLDTLKRELARRRQAGQRIAMTNGCFDLLHPGHVASLQAARHQGDCLVVGLNSDRSVRELKGESRPIIDQKGRSEMLAALACVDYVVIFDEASVEPLINQVLPDVLVKSDQYSADRVVGQQSIQIHGGHVVRVPHKPHYSTSTLIERVLAANSHGELQ